MSEKRPTAGVFTLTHALNYGAFYQMYAIAKYLDRSGYDVTVFDCQRTLKYRLLRLFSYNPRRQIRKFVLRRRFLEDRAAIQVERYKGQPLDLAILGSDEIWNLDNPSFEHAPEYVGLNINAGKVVAYAPSIGYASPDRLIENEIFRRGLSNIDGILARDEQTRQVAERITGRQVPEVVDPTILMGVWRDFPSQGKSLPRNYILYYGYKSNPVFKEALIAFAEQRSLRIYTAGFRTHYWCAENFACGPRDFLGLMLNATYVFTDTFHGVVMAALLDKQFCYAAPMQKIKHFARKIGIEGDALTKTSGKAEIEAALERDRSERKSKIEALRTQSRTELAALIGPTGHAPALAEK